MSKAFWVFLLNQAKYDTIWSMMWFQVRLHVVHKRNPISHRSNTHTHYVIPLSQKNFVCASTCSLCRAWWPTGEAVTVGIYLAVTVRGGSRDDWYLSICRHLWRVHKKTNVTNGYRTLQEIMAEKDTDNIHKQHLSSLIFSERWIITAIHKTWRDQVICNLLHIECHEEFSICGIALLVTYLYAMSYFDCA